ncbi:MAG: zinc-binding dehydrogenase [Thermoproteota archaeon]
MSFEHVGMACCGFGPTFGIKLMNVEAFDTALITGLGPVGLGGVINARYRGARVIGVENNSYRAKLAKDLGAEVVLDPKDEKLLKQVMDLTDGQGVDKAIEYSGNKNAVVFCIKATRMKGQVSIVGGLWQLHGAWGWRLHQ